MVAMNNIDDFRNSFESIRGVLSGNPRIIVIDSSNTTAILAESNKLISSGENIFYLWEEPQGIYHAMNTGITHSKDDSLVWFLNPGDQLTNPFLIMELAELIDTSDSKWGYGLASYDSDSSISPKLFPGILENNIHTLFSGELQISHQSMLVRKEVLVNLGMFNSKYRIAADLDLQFKLLAECPPKILAKHMIIVDTTGVSHRSHLRTLTESFMVRLKRREFSVLKTTCWFLINVTHRIRASKRLRLYRAN